MRKNKFGNKSEVIISLLLIISISLLAFVPFINKLGFYVDDWYIVWGYITGGVDKVKAIYEIDRPFAGYIVGQEFNLIGVNPINWQILMLLVHVSGSVIFFWLARLIWNNQEIPTLIMACLCSAYPGFLVNYQALTYQVLLIGVNSGLLSIILGIHAIQTKKIPLKILFSFFAFVLIFISSLITEWLIGILGVYILLVFYKTKELNKSSTKSILRALINSLPAFLGTGFFIIWRFFLFENVRKATDIGNLFSKYGNQMINKSFEFFLNTFRSFVSTAIMPWTVPLEKLWLLNQKKIFFTAFSFSSIAFIIVLLVLQYKFKNSKEKYTENHWAKNGMIIGILCVLITLIPVTFVGRQASVSSNFSRYTVNSISGTAILLASALFYFIKPGKIINFFVASLIFISVFTHVLNSNWASEIYKNQKDFWWQLSWRAPDIKNDTVFIPIGLNTIDAYEIIPPINLIYRPESNNIDISAQILNNDTAIEILLSRDKNTGSLRGIVFERDYRNLLLATKNSGSCLHLLDGNLSALAINQNPIIAQIATLSNISVINTQSASHYPPENIFGKEPAHDWCYFYQKASLAKQDKKWDLIIQLANELSTKRLHPLDVSEWMPFVEAYANLHKTQEMESIILRMKSDLRTVGLLCLGFTQEKPMEYSQTSDDVYFAIKQALCG